MQIDAVTAAVKSKLGKANEALGQEDVANLWTEFAAHEGEALISNGKEPQNPNKLVVAATFEMAKT